MFPSTNGFVPFGIRGGRSPRSASADQRGMFNLKWADGGQKAYRTRKAIGGWLQSGALVLVQKVMRERIHRIHQTVVVVGDRF